MSWPLTHWQAAHTYLGQLFVPPMHRSQGINTQRRPHPPVALKQQKAAAPRRLQPAPMCHAPWAAAQAHGRGQGLHRGRRPAAPSAAPVAASRLSAATPHPEAAPTLALAGGTGARRWFHARCRHRMSRGILAACRHHTISGAHRASCWNFHALLKGLHRLTSVHTTSLLQPQ